MAKNWELEYRRCEERCKSMPELPDDFYVWGKTIFSDMKWMVYKKHGAYADLFCCNCGRTETVKIRRGQSYEAQMVEKVFDMPGRNEIGECPWCREKVVFKAGMRSDHKSKEIAWIGQKYQKSSYVLRYFEITEEWGKGKKAEYLFHELARVFYIQGRRTIKKDYLLYNGMDGSLEWHPHNVGGFGNYTLRRGHIYPLTYKNMSGTAVEYSMAREYSWGRYADPAYRNGEWYWDIEWYLSQYWRYPVLEMLVKTKSRNLTEAVVHNPENHLRLDKRAKKPWDMLRIEKARLKDLLREDSTVAWNWYRYERENGIKMDDGLVGWYRSEGILPYMISEVKEYTNMTLVQIRNYLIKQSETVGSRDGQGTRIVSLIKTWEDYLEMEKRQGHDLSDAIVYRPKDLEQAHARAVRQSEMQDAEETAKQYYKEHPAIRDVMRKAADRYSYANGSFSMVMPKSIEEILIEGRSLHHCVSSSDRYIDRMEKEETYIGFVRRADKPDVPFYSVEFEPGGTVRQKRTYYNRHDEHLDDVVEFLREWQEYVKDTMTPQEKRKAQISERRRLEDMEEFYKNDPKFAKLTEEDLLVNSNVPPQIMLTVDGYVAGGAGSTAANDAGQQLLMPAM